MEIQLTNITSGIMTVGVGGFQKYDSILSSYSSIYTSIKTNINSNNKFSLDSCWETGYIYWCDSSGYLKKTKFDDTIINALASPLPCYLSVIQSANKMPTTVNISTAEDRGCWFFDKSLQRVIRVNNQLTISSYIEDVVSISAIVSKSNLGCFFVDNNLNRLVSIDRDANIIDERLLSDIDSGFGNVIDMAVDCNDMLWIATNNAIYNMTDQNGYLSKQFVIYPTLEEITCIDVDKNSDRQYLYVAGVQGDITVLEKYSNDGTLVISNVIADITYPYIIKVVQGYGSDCLYILEDTSKLVYYSSSSSSSSSS